MKTLLIVITALLFACALRAATVQWSLPTDFATVYYLKVDGKGGCAIWGTRTNGYVRVLWLDKKGAAIYNATHMAGSLYGVYFSGRRLVYSVMNNSKVETLLVDKKGAAVTLSDPADHLLLTLVVSVMTENMDKKGFFLQKLPTAPPSIITLVRYSYK